MRKLSFLMALLLCVTVGGVYAVWTYSGNTDIADRETEAYIRLEDATWDGASGSYTIKTNLKMTIDDDNGNGEADAEDSDKHASLLFAATDSAPIYLTITFTPSANADPSIKNYGVDSEFYVKFNGKNYQMDADGNYDSSINQEEDGTPILNFFNLSDGSFNANILPSNAAELSAHQWKWNAEEGYFEVTFDETALKEMITLNADFVLDSKSEWDAFHACLDGAVITLCITDGTVQSGGGNGDVQG